VTLLPFKALSKIDNAEWINRLSSSDSLTALPFRVRLCDNLEGLVTFSCRNLEVFLSSLLLF
jgi:hypothetical protein